MKKSNYKYYASASFFTSGASGAATVWTIKEAIGQSAASAFGLGLSSLGLFAVCIGTAMLGKALLDIHDAEINDSRESLTT